MYDMSFDLALADANSVKPLPLRKGVYSAKHLTEGQKFWQWVKTQAKFFREDFGKDYISGQGYVGDAFLYEFVYHGIFSDVYKDIYNERPHFDKHLIAMICGLPTSADTCIYWMWGKDVLQHFADVAKETREAFFDAYASRYSE